MCGASLGLGFRCICAQGDFGTTSKLWGIRSRCLYETSKSQHSQLSCSDSRGGVRPQQTVQRRAGSNTELAHMDSLALAKTVKSRKPGSIPRHRLKEGWGREGRNSGTVSIYPTEIDLTERYCKPVALRQC